MRQIKIISDGTPQNTKVLNEDGAPILCQKVTWTIDCDNLATATLEVSNVAVELMGMAETPPHERDDGTPL